MSLWAIAYDLDVKGMKAARYTKSNVTQFYTAIRTCLTSNNFEKMSQYSIYTSEKSNTLADVYKACNDIKAVSGANLYVKRLNLFRIDDLTDLTPLISTPTLSNSDKDAIEEEIDLLFADEK
ncbi:hypothetical protein [Gluconobacter albidus]|uniref:hypothetical protein n=1 Tax=Gluconobacter albidus TaxID=318683 RepID=UPI0030AB1670